MADSINAEVLFNEQSLCIDCQSVLERPQVMIHRKLFKLSFLTRFLDTFMA